MKKFNFNLETVLSYNNQVLDNIKSEYATALQIVRKQQLKLDNLINKHIKLNAQIREKEITGIAVAEAMSYEIGLRVLEKKIKDETKILHELEKQAEAKRVELLEAKKDAMTMEKLKDKSLEEYKKKEIKEQENLIDELVSLQRVISEGDTINTSK